MENLHQLMAPQFDAPPVSPDDYRARSPHDDPAITMGTARCLDNNKDEFIEMIQTSEWSLTSSSHFLNHSVKLI